jgi:hypothetical protein
MSVNRKAMRHLAAKSSMRWVINIIVALSASIAVLVSRVQLLMGWPLAKPG